MLFKKELMQICVGKPPKVHEDIQYRYSATAQKCTLKRSGTIICVNFFEIATGKLVMRFFSDRKNFVLYLPEEDKKHWIACLPFKVLSVPERKIEPVYCKPKQTDMVHDFLKKQQSPYHNYTQNVLDECNNLVWQYNRLKYEKAVEKRAALQKKHFSMFPKLPKGIQDYCEKHVLTQSYMFYGKVQKRERKAICGCCGATIMLPKNRVKYETTMQCPQCGKQSLFYKEWRKVRPVDKATLCICNRVKGNIIMRWTDVCRTYIGNKPNYSFQDKFYSLMLSENGQIKSYSYVFGHNYSMNWCRLRNGSKYIGEAHIYERNLSFVFGTKYCNVNLQKGLRNNSSPIDFQALLQNLKEQPITEYLFKMGLYRLAANLKYLNIHAGRNFGHVLGVNAQYLSMYKTLNPSIEEHELIKAYPNWISTENMLKFRKLVSLYPWRKNQVLGLLVRMSFTRFVNYFLTQKDKYPKRNISQIFTWYEDYINMSIGLNVDLSRKKVRFPPDIKKAHDILLPRFQAVKIAAENVLFTNRVTDLYRDIPVYENNSFQIVMPKSRTELIVEGQSLNHCVGMEGYFKNHISGERMIFFVRRAEEPKRPYFTMEIDMQSLSITQLYGFDDCVAPSNVRQFADKYLNILQTAMNGNNLAIVV